LPAGAPAPSAGDTNAAPGTVEFVGYTPKQLELKAIAVQPSVLLLNDKYDANWSVRVNGQPAELLRCNYLMRGVYLPAGTHAVEFTYHGPTRPLVISVGAIVVGLALLGALVVGRRQTGAAAASVAESKAT
jgi:uncharacterized membrane protein YfhO